MDYYGPPSHVEIASRWFGELLEVFLLCGILGLAGWGIVTYKNEVVAVIAVGVVTFHVLWLGPTLWQEFLSWINRCIRSRR